MLDMDPSYRMRHPYSGTASYIYVNEYETESDYSGPYSNMKSFMHIISDDTIQQRWPPGPQAVRFPRHQLSHADLPHTTTAMQNSSFVDLNGNRGGKTRSWKRSLEERIRRALQRWRGLL
ncbi:hypothetical protein VKT23_019688 [Stygiomarasmius scandens]|uniref:Uncharacterized protein n=1 Tax=Marasmiellus scandens TaxID=2682957 RepID=A0ABR1IPZ5_9AGAR